MSNGNSYQKFDGASGTYQEIPNNGSSISSASKKTKWLVAAALLVVVGIGYTAFSLKSNPSANVDKALASKGNVQVKANGKLKLFDSLSKCPSLIMEEEKAFSLLLSAEVDSLEILWSRS